MYPIGRLRLVIASVTFSWAIGTSAAKKGSLSFIGPLGQAVAILRRRRRRPNSVAWTALAYGAGYASVAFMMDDPGIVNRVIAGLPVYALKT